MSKRYLVYEKETGLCVNVIIWDEESQYDPGIDFDYEIIPAGSQAWTGWTRISEGVWQEPPQEENRSIAEIIKDVPPELLPKFFTEPPPEIVNKKE